MKRRVRWYQLNLIGVSVSRLAELMLSDAYKQGSSSGFRIDQASRTMIAGAFIEKFDLEDTVQDPFGDEIKNTRVEFRKVEFKLRSDKLSLELVDPPRSCKSFFRRIEELAEYQVSLAPIDIDVRNWVKALEIAVGRVNVTSIAVCGVALTPETSADVIVEGSVDVRGEALKLLTGRGEIVEMDVSWRRDETDLRCELTRNGANYDDSIERQIGTFLRSALRESIS